MNMVGWLAGAGTAPVVIGYIAQRESLTFAISLSALAQIGSAALLALGALAFVKRDVARLQEGVRPAASASETSASFSAGTNKDPNPFDS